MIDRVLLLLLAGCAISAALLFRELHTADTGKPAVVPAPARVEAPTAPRMQSPRVEDLLATALGRPLFSRTRRPPEGAKTDRPADPELPNMRLTGVVIEPGHHLAIFAVPGAKPLVRSEGETINEWRLDSIAPREVSLSGPGGTTTLESKTDPNLVRPSALAPLPKPLQPAGPGVQSPAAAAPQPKPQPAAAARAPAIPLPAPTRPPGPPKVLR